MSRPDVFSDESIIDEILAFFGAATLNNHVVLDKIIKHFCRDKVSLKRARDEF